MSDWKAKIEEGIRKQSYAVLLGLQVEEAEEGRVVISARSIGEANVQVILEALGGGGNAATAGAQIKDSTVDEVLQRLKESIDNYYDN